MPELARDIDHVATLVQQQRGELVAQVVRSRATDSDLGGQLHEAALAPLLEAMSDLLGRPIIAAAQTRRSPSLVEFARRRKLPEADIEMLAGIRFRGEGPKTPERWEFIYQAIKNSAPM